MEQKIDTLNSLYKLTKPQLILLIKDKLPNYDKKALKFKKDLLIRYIYENIDTRNIENLETLNEKYEKSTGTDKDKNIKKRYGLLKINKVDTEKFNIRQSKLIKYSYPLSGIAPSYIDDTADNRKLDTIKLIEHQKKLVECFFLSHIRGCIIFHGVGTGKTFTAVGITKLYLQLNPNNNVIIITPSAVLFNFVDSLYAYGIDPRDNRYQYFTYEKFNRASQTNKMKELLKKSLVVVDEAHNYRTYMGSMASGMFANNIKEEDRPTGNIEFGSANIRGQKLLSSAGFNADKIILLTATPFVNTTYDIENLLSMISAKYPLEKKTFGEIISNSNNLYEYMKYKISMYSNPSDNANFAERREKYIPIIISDDKFKARTSQTYNNFYNVSRRQGLTLKIDKIIELIKNDDGKTVIYTTFLEIIELLHSKLEKIGKKIGRITGKENTLEKNKAILDYNENKIDLLLITKAAAEGVSLLETRNIIIFDGQWNDALYEQIVARAIRYKSHAKLDKKYQYVNVYKLFCCYWNEALILDKLNSGGNFNFITFVQAINELKDAIKKANKDKDEKDRQNTDINIELNKSDLEILALNDGNFDEQEFKSLSREERSKYIKENLQFGKGREKYITASMSVAEGLPSTDFYLFCVQKSKQILIDKLVEKISKIPLVESYLTLMPEKFKEINGLLEKIENINNFLGKEGDINSKHKSMLNTLNKFIDLLKEPITDNDINKIINVISVDMKTQQKSFIEFLQNKMELDNLIKIRKRARVNQEFFTPQDVVDLMINESGLKNKEGNFRILEPTAGYGNIISGLLKLLSKKARGGTSNLKFTIDAVELLKENRKELNKIKNLSKGILNISEVNDFLKFVPSNKYDYIFMNPPFKIRNQGKTFYDIDFVMRAYAMLEYDTGRLIAITGDQHTKNEKFTKWLKSKNAIIKNYVGTWGETEKYGKAAEIKKLKYSLIIIDKTEYTMEEDNKLLEPLEEIKPNNNLLKIQNIIDGKIDKTDNNNNNNNNNNNKVAYEDEFYFY